MDQLKNCAIEFSKLFGKDFYYTLNNGNVIKLYFASKHFHHVMGLHKLKDLPSVMKSVRNTPTTIYKNIIKGKINFSLISKSIFFNDIEDRITNFHHINSLVFEKVVIDFDNEKVPSNNPAKIKSDMILFKDLGNFYLNLCLVKDSKSYNPETFLVQYDDYYIKNQNILRIIDLKIVASKDGQLLAHYSYNNVETELEIASSVE